MLKAQPFQSKRQLSKRKHSLQHTTAKGTAFAEQIVFALKIATLKLAELAAVIEAKILLCRAFRYR
jgi:hypothetical protein